MRVSALIAATLVPLALGSSSTAALHVGPAVRLVPDWQQVYPKGHDDDATPPLTLRQIMRAIAQTVGGPRLYDLRVTSGLEPFAGDRRLLATVSPNGDGIRDQAVVRFRLAQAARVTMDVMICSKHAKTVWATTERLAPGSHTLVWAPGRATSPRSYLLLLKVFTNGATHVYGSTDYRLADLQPAPVVRVQGVDAGFSQRRYAPGARAALKIATDAQSFTLQVFHAGPETQATVHDEMQGVPVSEPRLVDWSAHRNAPATLTVHLGDWANGIYFARLTAADGRVGYAPFVVRPARYGLRRIAYVFSTNTWEAYNHDDADGDGWGDTWYATDSIRNVDLSRHYIGLGAPPKWRMYDLPPLHWLYKTGKDEQVDFLTDDELQTFRSSKQLARLYKLIVFPNYDEYETTHVYDLLTGYRNLGGNLMFLSATNFLWRVNRHANRLTRIEQWRFLDRPESSLVGVQYRGSDEGEHRGYYTVSPYGRSSWVFAGVDPEVLRAWHWFGIEYDMPTSASPRGIHVLARVNPHMGDGRIRGVMTYYQRGRAKVFASGTLNFPASMWYQAYRQVLENIWSRLEKP
jgi:hypothetical protein